MKTLILKQKLIDIAESQMARRGTFSVTFTGCKAMYVSGGATITVLKDGTGTTRIYAAKSVHCTLAEKNAYVMFSCNTGGAMRMNIVIKGVHNKHSFRFNRQRNTHGGVGDEVKESSDDSGMSSFSLRKLEEARAYIYRFPKPTQKAAKFDYTWRILANWEQGGNHQTSLDEEIGDPEDVEMVDSRQYMEGFRDDCNEFMEFS
ncbi:hypothetical protein Bca52824_052856 [Brassica carinata]|uniref:Uncharacterized protein n=1 Tax=Brassica carinata TaxID=52824 RepID=A0A8X7R4L3_BRACI|nr:hypothetical protein Bca52824_052856 [Brassica carinata]